jgi:hypothetical protein
MHPMYARRSLSPAALLGTALLVSATLAGPLPLRAGSTNAGELHMPQGTGAGTANGDYLTSTAGLNTFYRYFIEVPSGLSNLVVEVFDADVGVGGTAESAANRDRDRGNGFSSTATYTLLRPDGTTAATTAGCNATTCTDNGWQVILNSTTAQNTAAGHWELQVTMGGSDDINAIGVRANDGTSGAGGTELPVYIDSLVSLGVNPPASGSASRSYTLYPYVTSGCTALENDFDYDSDAGTVGSLVFSSRTATFTQTVASASLSINNVWTRNTINRWTSDQKSTEYGIWQGVFTIDSYTNANGINGNYTDVYIANSSAAANPPAANPVTNGFRIYLPTDAGAAPVKPYLEQLLTYSGCGAGNDGPNPAVVGTASCYTVTVRLVNPAAKAITFSATHLVTANIPGAGAVYAGLPVVSQGTVVSQPAVGGTGNITWNPGTVAAGSTQLLAYRVKVTPTSAGQRIPATGTPASNGTKAVYVDETGNATQARALFTFGPLCELAVTQNLITQAVVSSFHASPADGGGVLLEWKTASEAGTAGFYVERWDAAARRFTRVNRELLAGLLHAPQGGVYRFVDTEASPAEPRLYRLEEIEAGGRTRLHGPFAAVVDWDRKDPRRGAAPGSFSGYQRTASPAPGRTAAEDEAAERKAAAQVVQKAVAASPYGVHIPVRSPVRQAGLQYLRTADVAAWLGLPAGDAGKMIAEGKVNLTRGDQPVAWYPDLPAGAGRKDTAALGLYFYGQVPATLPESLYGDAGVYRLQKGRGLLMTAVPAGAAGAPASDSFAASLHVEQDVFAATVLPLDPRSDYWFWEFLQGDDPNYGARTFTLAAPGVASGSGATLTVHLQGATASGVAGEHRVAVAINGTALGETSWTGITAQTASFAVPPGTLLAAGSQGNNQVTLTAHTGSGAPYSILYLNGFDLAYPRRFTAAGDALAFPAQGGSPVAVGGFASAAVRLLDVSNPLHPRWLNGAAVGPDGAGGYQVSFTPPASGSYLAVAAPAVPVAAADRAWSAPALKAQGNRARYLVIAPAAFHDAAERLADTRRAQGLEAMTVDLEQIWDEMNGGVSSPEALRGFLAYAFAHWSVPPRYVALAGTGTFDYRNLLGFGDERVPPLMLSTPGGLFASDNLLGDVDGDGLPEMAVGRIPVVSAAELDGYTAKLAAYEGAPAAAWTGTALLLSDVPDQGGDFAADSDGIAGQLSGLYATQRIDLATTPLADARAQLLAALGTGAGLVNYTGHGGLDRLSSGGLLTDGDVPALTAGGRSPLITALTCVINRFDVPGIPSLGELLAKSPAGGAVAVWGPTGLSASGEARLLGERFYHSPGSGDGTGGTDARLGDRALRATAEFRTLGGDPTLPLLYGIVGDPALRLQQPPVPAPGTRTGTPE